MLKFSRHLIMSLVVFLAPIAALGSEKPNVRKVEVTPIQVEAASMYRDGDIVRVTIRELFPDSCYRAGPVELHVSGYDVFLRDTAFRYEGHVCLAVLYPNSKVVELGALPAGEYRLHVQEQGIYREAARFSVAKLN